MLTELKISNFVITENLEMELDKGLSTVTGETGAGKSIMIDALALALGDRADSKLVGSKVDKAQITASFDISDNDQALKWLDEKSLDAEGECILRRVIGKDGKSRAFINGVPSPLQDVKTIAELLINIHSQHQHQQLLNKESHRELIDNFSGGKEALTEIRDCFIAWQNAEKQLAELEQNQNSKMARIEFLEFQLEELNALELKPDEYQQLNEEHKMLANIDEDLILANEALSLLNGSEIDDAGSISIGNSLSRAQQIFRKFSEKHPALKPALDSLENAVIQIEESSSDLRHYVDDLENDPERLSVVDEKLSRIHELARKHHVKPENLFEYMLKIQEEHNTLVNTDISLEALNRTMTEQQNRFIELSASTSRKRKSAAKQLEKTVNTKLNELGMADARIAIKVESLELESANAYGMDRVEILVSTNPSKPPQSLNKIASGGELSRISLALQVGFAEKISIPCLIFDEVDVGIGGATAEVVGKLLRQLSEFSQVICVTHLAQVAVQGHQQFKVEKINEGKEIASNVRLLDDKERIEEIARMMGGVELTRKTQSHAREMLSLVQ